MHVPMKLAFAIYLIRTVPLKLIGGFADQRQFIDTNEAEEYCFASYHHRSRAGSPRTGGPDYPLRYRGRRKYCRNSDV